MRNTIALISARFTTLSRSRIGSVLKSVMFAVLLWAASAAGSIPIPGTPVPITLQTFVVMLAGLMLTWRQAGAAVGMYLAAGVRRWRFDPGSDRPERRLPDRLPSGRDADRRTEGRGTYRYREAHRDDRRTVSAGRVRRLRRA